MDVCINENHPSVLNLLIRVQKHKKNSDNGFKCQKILFHFLVTELIIIACGMEIFSESVWRLCGVKAGVWRVCLNVDGPLTVGGRLDLDAWALWPQLCSTLSGGNTRSPIVR